MDSRGKILRQFGERLTFLRAQKGLSIAALAEAAELEYQQLEEIEDGKINPHFTTLVALAEALDISPEELLETL